MVADAVIYHPTVAHYLKFIQTTIGRDKALRTVQYFARFYAWYLLRTNASPSSIRPFEIIKKQFALTRKLLRMGKNVEHLKAAAQAADSRAGDVFLRYCAVGRQLGYAIYLTFDMATYFDAAGIRSLENAKRLQREAYKAWLMGIFFNTVAGFYTLYHLNKRTKLVDKKDPDGAVQLKTLARDRSAAREQLVCDLCDLTVPGSALGIIKLDDGVIGLLGLLSSFIGIRNVWRKTA